MSPDAWTFATGKSDMSIPIHSRLVVNTAETAIDAAIAGNRHHACALIPNCERRAEWRARGSAWRIRTGAFTSKPRLCRRAAPATQAAGIPRLRGVEAESGVDARYTVRIYLLPRGLRSSPSLDIRAYTLSSTPMTAGRPGRQERHPDRRVRPAEGGRGRHDLGRSCGARSPHPPAPDPDDVLRLHPGRGAARGRDGRRCRNAAVARHGRAVRHDRRDLLRPPLHACLLRGGEKIRAQATGDPSVAPAS